MGKAKYDKSSVDSIVDFAKALTGKTLAEAVDLPKGIENERNRGNLGLLIENYYFEISPSSSSEPDFPEAGLELKTTGVLKNAHGKYVAKERLVLKMINYTSIIDETWESSELLMKCNLMLILFYLFEKDVAVFDRRFVLDPLVYQIPDVDLPIIREDWERIREMVRRGKAHELSEGDSYYLSACRKGAGGMSESLLIQPHSSTGAKSRAFSFKPSYINTLIDGRARESGKLGVSNSVSFEEATRLRFQPYIGKTIDEISADINYFKLSPNHKGFLRDVAVRMLADGKKSVSELDKAGVEMKTIRLKADGVPRESMSFPGFKFLDILNEKWEESKFYDKIEKKFLFIIFRTDSSGIERLERVKYWNMPYKDRMEARKVWEETKRRVKVDATNLPRQSESRVAHVRPKGRNGQDSLPTPQGGQHLKQCFWLNNSYIRKILKDI